MLDEDAAGVAQPDAVGGPAVEADVRRQRICFVEQLADLAFGCGVVDDQLNPLVTSEIADDFGMHPRDRLELAGPIAVIVGPCEPGCGVRLPLGGHAVTERGRRLRGRASD